MEEHDKETRKKTVVQAIVLAGLLLLTLPLVYLLVARVLLPLEWNEPHLKDSTSESQ